MKYYIRPRYLLAALLNFGLKMQLIYLRSASARKLPRYQPLVEKVSA